MKIKKIIPIFSITVILLSLIIQPFYYVHAQEPYITVGEYLKNLTKDIRIEKDDINNNDIDYAIHIGLIKSQKEFDLSQVMTAQVCGVISNRADIYLYGKSKDNQLFENVKSKKRIKDLDLVKKEYEKDIIEVFSKGIMVGESNGLFSQDRVIHTEEPMSIQEEREIRYRIIDKKKRYKMTFDGQVIRDYELPYNAKDFSYILESFPNEFYEMSYRFENSLSNKRFEEFKDYCFPIKIHKMLSKLKNSNQSMNTTPNDEYISKWTELIEKNLQARFNVNYALLGQQWIDTMKETYNTCQNEEEENKLNNSLMEYIKSAKKNKVIVESERISVEPSILYYSMGNYYLRCYVKFRVTSCNEITEPLIYCTDGQVYFNDLKKHEWHEGYYDIAIGTSCQSCFDYEYGIHDECISDYLMKIKDRPLNINYNNIKDGFFKEGYYYWK